MEYSESDLIGSLPKPTIDVKSDLKSEKSFEMSVFTKNRRAGGGTPFFGK